MYVDKHKKGKKKTWAYPTNISGKNQITEESTNKVGCEPKKKHRRSGEKIHRNLKEIK